MSGGVNSGSVYGMRGGRGYYSRGRGGRGEETKEFTKALIHLFNNKQDCVHDNGLVESSGNEVIR